MKEAVVLVSGGIDSMVMTNLFLRTGYKFGMAHCNFGLRGEESDGDEALVTDFASTRSIPFYLHKMECRRWNNWKIIRISVLFFRTLICQKWTD